MSVTIHGIVCKNCFDVDWAKRVEAEDKKKEEAEAAKKAKEWLEPAGSTSDTGDVDQGSGLDDRSAIVFDGALKRSHNAASTADAVSQSRTTGQSVNIVV